VRDIAVIGLLALGVLMTLRRPWFGVLLWTWIGIMCPHRYCYGFASTAPVAAVAAGVALFGWMLSRDRQNPWMGPPVKWMIVFACWMTLSWALGYGMSSSDPVVWGEDYNLWKQVLKTFLMLLVALALIRNQHQIVAYIAVTAMSLGILGIKGGVFTVMTLGSYRVWGPSGSFIEDNNDFGLALVSIVPLLVFLLLQLGRNRKWLRIGLVLTIVVCVLAIAGSKSRGAFVALAAMGGVLWWRGKYKFKLALLIVAVAGAIWAVMPEEYWNRIDTITAADEDDSFQSRVRSWKVAIQVANHHVTGAGMMYKHPKIFEMWDYSETKDRGRPIAPHSIYFQILGNHGYIGLFFYLMMGVSTWRGANWLRRHAKDIPEAKWTADLGAMVQVSMAGFAVGGGALSLAYYDIPFNLMVMVLLARRWVETKGWERDPGEGFFRYMFSFGEPCSRQLAAVGAR